MIVVIFGFSLDTAIR